jgi:hypothetical protein
MGFLYQLLDAEPYRGKVVTLRAAVRAEVLLGSTARLLVRIHRQDCSISFRDDMGNSPVRSAAWAFSEVWARIARDARHIEFGMQMVGQGAAWIDHVSLDFAGPSP